MTELRYQPEDYKAISETFYRRHNADAGTLAEIKRLVDELPNIDPQTERIIQATIAQITKKLAQEDTNAATHLGISVEEFVGSAEAASN